MLPSASPPVVVNEVFYDAAGADAGYQFVELANTRDVPIPLVGYRLESGDGAGPNRWKSIWNGTAAEVIPARGFFVLGESLVSPRPDHVLAFDLENGPDAVRLTSPDGARDVVGYGALSDSGYFEGAPAEDVPGGYSLARVPDAIDTNDNAHDFLAVSPPTPSVANRPERDVALVAAVLDPERAEPGDVIAFRGTLVNRGTGVLASSELRLLLFARGASGGDAVGGGVPPFDSLVASAFAGDDLDSGDSVHVELSFVPPGAGAWDVTLATRVDDDGVPANDRVPARLQVGPGPLIVSEVESAPADGPEWVELQNRSAAAIVLDGWTLEDATGKRAVVAGGAGGFAFAIEPDSFVVLTSDPAALMAILPTLQPRAVASAVPWPPLNNTGTGDAPADRVVVRDPDGRVSDAMSLPDASADGAPLERRARDARSRDASTWGESAEPGGTPGRANSLGALVPGAGVALTASAGVLSPRAGERLLFTYRTGFVRARVTLTMFDLRGRPVRHLLDDEEGPGQAGAAWDGAGGDGAAVAPGIYIAGLEARDASGASRPARARVPVVVR